MERIERIVPYKYRKDGEFEPYLDFSKINIPLLDPNFSLTDEIFNVRKEDHPYESHKKTLCYGSAEKGIEICIYEEYEPIKNEKVIDRVNVKAYGLNYNTSYEIEASKIGSEPDYLEIRLKGSDESINTIAGNFYHYFEKTPTAQKQLKNELLILQTAIRRKAWNLVEIRAQNILRDFPDNLEAKISLTLAQTILGELKNSEKEIDEYIDYAIFGEKRINEDELEKKNIISLLNQVKNLEPENNDLQYIIGQLYEKIGLKDEALHIYQSTLVKIENNNEINDIEGFIESLKRAVAKLVNK